MKRRTRFYLIAVAVLFLGWLSAALVYQSAADDLSGALGFEFADGQVYTIDPGDSKMYRHELERFGGKAAVFADELDRWFSGLWKGKRLAKTLAVLSLVIALLILRAAGNGPDEPR